jgi:hypothetical protein
VNPKSFLGMMSDISDEYIASAANPHSKSIHWYQVSAIAACIVLLIAAVIYPKLRIQAPEIAAPPESVAEVITTTTTVSEFGEHPDTQTTISPIQTTFASVTATVNTTASVAATVAITETDASVQTDISTDAKPPQTDVTVFTDLPKTDISITATAVTIETTAFTEQHIETTDNPGIPAIIEDPTIEVPLWKGITMYPGSVSEPHLYSRFSFSTGDMDAWMRTLYGIPQDFDLTQNQCLLIEIDTAYSDAVIIGCRQTPNGLTLIVAYLDDGITLNKTIHYAMPIPDDMTLEPDNCNANYLELTDEELIQEMEKEKLELKTGNEQEGLQ